MREKVERYIRSVTDGTLTAGRFQRASVERHIYDLSHATNRGYYFDEKKAEAALGLFPLAMRHTKGEWAGKPFELSDNQAFIVWCLFGWRRQDGTRRFRHAYICCARKWGKSEFAAALGLIAVSFDDPLEPGAEVYCAATKEDQAKIVFSVAQQMARSSPVLRELVNVNAKSITTKNGSPQPFSSFKPLGSDSKTSDGFNVHVCVLDEIHEWRERHRGLYEKLTTAHGSRRQPLIITITTAGDDLSDIWNEMDALCVSALERFDEADPPGDNRFAFIARLDEQRPCDCGRQSHCVLCGGKGEIAADDPFDSANWPKANPNYPVTPKHEFLEEQAADARHNPASKHAFLRYHCNLKVSALDKAIAQSVWSAARGELSDWKDADVVCGAWDMGGQDDLGAIGYAARYETGEFDEDGNPIYRYEVDAKAFINTDNERDITREPFVEWVRSGLLTVSANEIIEMREQIVSDYRNGVSGWAYDPANSRDFAASLEMEGLTPFKFFQNASMWTEPLTRFLSDLKRGRIRHNGNGLLAWAATNMITVNVSRAASIQMLPDKRTSPEKIDPIVAVIMAYRCAMVAPARYKGRAFIY